ncbi:MAG TPA: hypothetical protein VNN12_00315, partial [Dehalococcoidia bacterium]|nr:hypothetical protein [Dehalococcoidia bacterium]
FFRAQFAPIRLPAPVRAELELANGCRVRAERPVYADLWRTRTHVSLHLVNYAGGATPVRITSRFGPPERIVVPEGEPVVVDGRLLLQSYGLVLWNRATIADEAQ